MFKKLALFVCLVVSALCSGVAGAATDFRVAAQLLAAARAGDVKYVEILVNAGADVNYVDSTGLSIVCTALMNNDLRAAQILQIYGADASRCDQQIKGYQQKLPKEESGGLFSGLSNAQSIALAAAGAAIVAGGIIWLGSILGNSGGHGGGGGGDRPTTNPPGDGITGGATEWTLGALPVGPAPDYNLDFYSPTDTTDVRYLDFHFFNTAGVQNYLLMMNGYSPLARGYLGMRTLRYADRRPFPLTNVSFNNIPAGGGKPVVTALVTTNGINPTGSAEDGWLVWAECNGAAGAASGCTSALANANTVSRKYYNNTITRNGDSLAAWTVAEDPGYDLSGNGTVFNPSATDAESMPAKIVAGWYADGRAVGDFLGFMPNGQLIIYRTGGGNGGTIDINNYQAMFLAAALRPGGVAITDVIANAALVPTMRSADTSTIADVLASANNPSYGANDKKNIFLSLINSYYDDPLDNSAPYNPGQYAGMLYAGQGTLYTPMIVMSTGEFEIGSGPGASLRVQEATFENAAPAFYDNLNQRFMSVAAVQLDGAGTLSAASVTGFNAGNTNKYHLAAYEDSGIFYGARACGQAGKGTASVDPWCFAAAGENGAQATAAAAGAFGAVLSAFSYMSSAQVFTLLALTSDGPWLGTIGGIATTREMLAGYLQGMYVLPNEYQFRVDSGEDYLGVFAEVFGYGLINLERATTPGTRLYFYGGTNIGSNTGNHAYWRSASALQVAGTTFSPGSAFGARGASISVPVFDYLENVDGTLGMPRVFENNFSFDSGRRGMYMGDVLGEFKTEQRSAPGSSANHQSPISVSMSFSESNRMDYQFGGLDELSFGYAGGNHRFGAGYQRRFADTSNVILRGDASNPVLSLIGNAINMSAASIAGNWTFGARAVSGRITDETLMETDPAISGHHAPMYLGWAGGAESSAGYAANGFEFGAALGVMRESATVLGTVSDGMLNLGGGDTVYADATAAYSPVEWLRFSARATAARTTASPTVGFITGLSALESNAFSVGMDVGNFSFLVSRPLAVSRGLLEYATANWEIVESDSGYDLDADPYIAHLNLRPDVRETRISAAYRRQLGDVTTGAIGFIYRINPNHTNMYGNEGILMFKINHKMGI